MNAREEFIKHIGGRKVLCAKIQKGDGYDDDSKVFNLTTGSTEEDRTQFLNDLNFDPILIMQSKASVKLNSP